MGEERGTYQFGYTPESTYARAMALLERHRSLNGEVVVDLGCGYGAIAEPVRELGLVYLGVDVEAGGLKSLAERRMETLAADIGCPDVLLAELDQALGGRPVAALCALDAVEHLANAEELLATLSRWSLGRGGVPLVVSIPNVTHVDLGVKLLLGRWDVTPIGLLDATHLRFFSPDGLGRTMAGAGWGEAGAEDFELPLSDQHFPADAVPLERSSPIGALLASLRRQAAPGWITSQFVRAYLPRQPAPSPGPTQRDDGAPFLSVLVRTTGTRMTTLAETLLSLAAQSCDDFEVLVLAHHVADDRLAALRALVDGFEPRFARRVRVVQVVGGGRARPLNVGARQANGRYLAAVDDDDVVFAPWVETLRQAASVAPGRVLHMAMARQEVAHVPGAWAGHPGAYTVRGRPRCAYPQRFDFVDHLRENATPNNGYAVPRSFVADMGQEYDESLPVFEDWDFLLRAASVCGAHSTGVVGGLVRAWVEGDNSFSAHDETQWQAAQQVVKEKLDRDPLLLGSGSRARLVGLLDQVHDADRRQSELARHRDELAGALEAASSALASARAEVDELRASSSWRVTAPLRALTGRLRRRG